MNANETMSPFRREPSRRKRRKARRRRNLRRVLAGILAVLTLAVGLLLWQKHRPLPGEGVAVPEYVTEDLLPVNRFSRPPRCSSRAYEDGCRLHPHFAPQ